MSKIAVLGMGNWGTALANHLSLKGMDVLGWCPEPEVAKEINASHRNPLYQSSVTLSSELKATTNLVEVLDRKYIVLVFPSQFLGEMLPKIRPTVDSPVIISAIKGLESESLKTPLQYAASVCASNIKLSVVSGPSFARDVVAGKPCGVVAASSSEAVAREVAELFSGQQLRAYVSTDPLGVEMGGVLKNVIAVAAGVCDALNLGDSARAAVITRGLAEITRLGVAMGAKEQTFFGLAGMGDLLMTASCDTSRNRTVGLRLGRGESLKAIIESLGSVAEGVKTAPAVQKLAMAYKVEMPISSQVLQLIEGKVSPAEMIETLMSRPLKSEFVS